MRRCSFSPASRWPCFKYPSWRRPASLIANALLVPHWATADEFRRLEGLGLTMYGQMTAGSWIYIGTQGILQGTYETLAECARQSFGWLSPPDGSPSPPVSAAWAVPSRWR